MHFGHSERFKNVLLQAASTIPKCPLCHDLTFCRLEKYSLHVHKAVSTPMQLDFVDAEADDERFQMDHDTGISAMWALFNAIVLKALSRTKC